jgi:alkanesulfonate monooxygenase SsuD/methylene tetrahydromethanopterin reductase-like flavin-dependent oxidoreductase (luciferase family)
MDIGIGLPATIPGVDGRSLVDWAQRAERHGFASLGTIDRIVYPNYEPLIALAAAAAVTQRIRLATAILIAPLRSNAALLAKQAASVQALSGGRLVLGVAPGGRADDFDVSGVDMGSRGREFDRQLDELTRVWAGEEKGFAGPVGPNVDPPELLIGGSVDAAFRRAAQHGDGWIMGGGSPDDFRAALTKLSDAWASAGREGVPRKAALGYFSLGAEARRNADDYLNDYYGWLGDPIAGYIAGSALVTDEAVVERVADFEDAGCDELILFPCSSDPEQVDLLARAVGMGAAVS